MSMSTTQLQRFATNARTQLMTAVRAKLNRALAPNSDVQINMDNAFTELQNQLAANGEDALVELYAYRWFNRIIAFRYMDVMGFTTTPVVSSTNLTDVNGMPAVLTAAKRGEYEPDVFEAPGTGNTRLHNQIEALFNGGTTNGNAQAEAYGLILQAECRYWNQYMPFMFPNTNSPAGRIDELLMPADLLAEGSVLRNAIEVMTPEACGVDEPGGNVEIIGWLYQYYISERKDEVMAGFKKKLTGDASTIPAATQLFTPDWIVRYLVQNTVGRLWIQSHPESTLADHWEYYIQPTEDAQSSDDALKVKDPEDLTVCDPACGSGHMLTYAFDLLTEIYEEQGYAPSEIPGLILEHNLFGMDIDERAADLAAFALTMKARANSRRFFRKQVLPHITQIRKEQFTHNEVLQLNELFNANLDDSDWNTYADADVTGSLIQPPALLAALAEYQVPTNIDGLLLDADLLERAKAVLEQTSYLARQYDAVVANPPYMGNKNMGTVLKEYAQANYKDGKGDLFAAFMLRCLQLVKHQGIVGMVTMQSWMFLSSYEKLRSQLLATTTIDTMAHLGAGAFDSISGEVVSTTAFTILNAPTADEGIYLRLVDIDGDQNQAQAATAAATASQPYRYTVDQREFEQIPGSPVVYWLPESILNTFNLPSLSTIAECKHGMSTGRNDEFIRRWHEISLIRLNRFCKVIRDAFTKEGWVPYNKGGEYRKWYGNQGSIVRYDRQGIQEMQKRSGFRNDGHDFFFLPSISWSKISSGEPAFRFFPSGFIFDVAGCSFFPQNAEDYDSMIGIVNSSFMKTVLSAISPTLNFEVGQVSSLPMASIKSSLTPVRQLISISKSDWDSYETSWDFERLLLLEFDRSLPLEQLMHQFLAKWDTISEEQRQREVENNEIVADAYGVRDVVPCDVPIERVSLKRNKAFVYPKDSDAERTRKATIDTVKELISYAVGCMFGRYSLDKPGLILASQGGTLDDYHRQIPAPSFEPTADNIIPIGANEYFEDDIVVRFRDFFKVAFGERNLEENIRFIEQVLGKSIRDYFVENFYDDHLRMYSNRPIYWQYSSRTDKKGSFNALMYIHRYTPATTNAALGYLRDFTGRIADVANMLEQSDRTADKRNAEKLRKAVIECKAYEDQTLYPLAATNLPMDLDDGVLVNYLRMGAALRKVPSIEKKRKDVSTWIWPHNPLKKA